MNPQNEPILDEKRLSPTNAPKKNDWKSITKEILLFVFIAIITILPFRMFVAEPYLVDGRSMDPTFTTGQYLIVDKLSYEIGTPKRNSVLIFKFPGDTKKNFIKRIIGLPGETVVVKDNTVRIINSENPEGFELDQSYVVYTSAAPYEVTLAGDEYFVMGDNRAESYDSRSWGPLNKKYIVGKPLLRLFPFTKLAIFPGNLKQ